MARLPLDPHLRRRVVRITRARALECPGGELASSVQCLRLDARLESRLGERRERGGFTRGGVQERHVRSHQLAMAGVLFGHRLGHLDAALKLFGDVGRRLQQAPSLRHRLLRGLAEGFGRGCWRDRATLDGVDGPADPPTDAACVVVTHQVDGTDDLGRVETVGVARIDGQIARRGSTASDRPSGQCQRRETRQDHLIQPLNDHLVLFVQRRRAPARPNAGQPPKKCGDSATPRAPSSRSRKSRNLRGQLYKWGSHRCPRSRELGATNAADGRSSGRSERRTASIPDVLPASVIRPPNSGPTVRQRHHGGHAWRDPRRDECSSVGAPCSGLDALGGRRDHARARDKLRLCSVLESVPSPSRARSSAG